MREEVGQCVHCGKTVYCENGFLNGVTEENKLYCMECGEEAGDGEI
ncbi:hypothetical protein [Jeotgalibacillus sp. R-1-5s-1]|nr:hypothetical protein [Jeotgalibacillus sp. R-1-5s-1]